MAPSGHLVAWLLGKNLANARRRIRLVRLLLPPCLRVGWSTHSRSSDQHFFDDVRRLKRWRGTVKSIEAKTLSASKTHRFVRRELRVSFFRVDVSFLRNDSRRNSSCSVLTLAGPLQQLFREPQEGAPAGFAEKTTPINGQTTESVATP